MKLSQEAKEIRGFILTICKYNYPAPCSLEVISLTIQENQFSISPAQIKGYIEYLEEKGYVRAAEKTSEVLGITRTVVTITAKGIDLMEGNIPPDPGILLPRLS
jgi:DNA-binding PadR family transcriptional regulator